MNLIIFAKQQTNKILRYSLVGLINTALTSWMMYSLSKLGLHFVIYTALSYFCGMTCSFILNLQITFQVTGYIKKRLANFFLINITNLLIVEIIEIYLIMYLHWQHFTAIVIAMFWYVCFGFIMNQSIAFRQNYSKNIDYARNVASVISADS